MAKLITKTSYNEALKVTEAGKTTVNIIAIFDIAGEHKPVDISVVIDAALNDEKAIIQFESVAGALIAVYESTL